MDTLFDTIKALDPGLLCLNTLVHELWLMTARSQCFKRDCSAGMVGRICR